MRMPVPLDRVNVTIERLLERPWPFDGHEEDWTSLYRMVFSQLGRSQKLLRDLPPQDLNSNLHLVSYETLYGVVTRISTQLEDHLSGRDISISRGEYMLENLLDVRWWTWVIALGVADNLKLDYDVYFGSPNEGVSEAEDFSPCRRSDSVVRSLPSYGFELHHQKAWECWKKVIQFSDQVPDGEDLAVLLAEVRNAEVPVFEIKLSAPNLHAGKPSSMKDSLEIDLTQDFLGAGSEGYVIRTTCSEEACALKRIDTLDENPPDLALLSHPHVVHLKYHWSEKSGPHDEARGLVPKPTFMTFLVMELMDGDLANLMRATKQAGVAPFSLPVSVDLMLQIAKGMLYLHEMGVSHSHLRCENILCRIENDVKKTLQVGDVLVKLGGFGRCSSTANANSKNGDIFCFGLTCLEILTGGESWSDAIHGVDNGSRPAVPETVPPVLKYCIESCLDPELAASKLAFPEVVTLLRLAQLQILQTGKVGPMVLSSKSSPRREAIQPENKDCASLSRSDCGLHEMFPVHQLYPQPGKDVSTSNQMTLIFFHGFPKVSEEWRMTWMTRDNELLWPEKWLPEDVCKDIRVLSVSYDDHLDVSSDQYLLEIGKNVLQSLVLSTNQWNLGETNQVITLVGHSLGGVIIKALVREAQEESRKHIRGDIEDPIPGTKSRGFLENLASVVFFSVPHAQTSTEFKNYVSGCSSTRVLKRSSLLASLRRKEDHFVSDMIKLSADFESAVPKKKVLAFLEGKPMSKKTPLLAENLQREGPKLGWEYHTVAKDNHFEVCRPDSKDHAAYKILVQHLQKEQNLYKQRMDNQKGKKDKDSRRVISWPVLLVGSIEPTSRGKQRLPGARGKSSQGFPTPRVPRRVGFPRAGVPTRRWLPRARAPTSPGD